MRSSADVALRSVFVGTALLLGIAGCPVRVRAHEHHNARGAPMAHHPGDSAMATVSSDSLPTSAASDTTAIERFVMPPTMEALGEHLHNKLIHFPIVLSPLALLTLYLSRRRPELLRIAQTFAWLAAISAGAALWAGLAQASDFKGEPKEWLVAVHRNWGIATTTALTLAALLSLGRATRRHAWILALLAVIFVSVGAYLGGLISHG